MLIPIALAQEVPSDDERHARVPSGVPADVPGDLPAAAPAAEAPATTGRVIVGFHAGARADMAAKGAEHGATLAASDDVLRYGVYQPRDARDFVRRMREDPDVRYVEEEGIMQAYYVPNDANWTLQYGPQNVGAPAAWDLTRGSTSAAVCIADTGVRYTHEDINGTRWKGGYDFINNDADPMDDNGHGTHVAGTAAATLNNTKGIAGMGLVAVYGVKVLDAAGFGSWTAIANGIRWCADNTMNRTVISLSLGGSMGSTTLHDAVKYAVAKGRLVVAAAGNSGCEPCVGFPAAYPEVLAVGCTTSTRALCSFSSRGPEVDISAPGHQILSTWHTGNGAYHTISGTSMSTPHVSGAAALIWSRYTNLTAGDLRVKLMETARDLGAPAHDNGFGVGELNLSAALAPRLPGVPRDFNVTKVGTRVEVAWDHPLIQGGVLRSYQIFRQVNTTNALLATVNGSTFGFSDSSCANMTNCRYSVRAVGVYGAGPSTPQLLPAANRAPILGALACAPNVVYVGQVVTCSVMVDDDSIGVFHNLTWGDGTWTRVPAAGHVRPEPLVLSHVYATAGNRTATLRTTDTGGAATTRSAAVAVQAVNDCGTGGDAGNSFVSGSWITAPRDCTGTFTAGDVYDYYRINLTAGQTLNVTMTPNGQSDYDLCLVRPDGSFEPCPYVNGNGSETRVKTIDVSGAWGLQVWNYSGGGPYRLQVNASAPGANAPPAMRSLTCLDNPARRGDTTTCLFRAEDDSVGVYYMVNWGDGSAVQRVPASGLVRPGSTQSATHAWANQGTFPVTVQAFDAGGLSSSTFQTYQFVDA